MSDNGKNRKDSAGRPSCSIHDVELSSSGECPKCAQLMGASRQPDVRVFENGDDDGYRAWVAVHRGGYVINIQKSFNPADARLHQATCPTINGEPARGDVFVGDYVKVCGLRRTDLDGWAADSLGAGVPECELCF